MRSRAVIRLHGRQLRRGEYDRALIARGDVTIWLTPAAIAAWKPERAGVRGRPREYSQMAIEAALVVRMVFRLPWR